MSNVQSSPVQSSPVQSSPVQSSPVQSTRLDISNNSGIISVVALGMFALMMYFSVIIMQNVTNRYNDIRNSLNYKQAQILADSGSEFLLWTLKRHEAGYNLSKECNYNAGEAYTPDGTVCDNYEGIVPGKDFKLTVSIKARAESISAGDEKDENLRTDNCRVGFDNISGACYVVPFPKTGTANEDCKRYKPIFGASGSGNYVPVNLANGEAVLDQLDFSCNWNKLKFGSSMLDRVSIPLYYESGVDVDGAPIIVNPFFDDGFPLAEVIGLRIRTPCRCGKVNTDGSITDGGLDCRGSTDETVCTDDKRYVLDDGSTTTDGVDDIVVQWQINGKCDEEECGLIADPNLVGTSALHESIINKNTLDIVSTSLKSDSQGIETDTDIYGSVVSPKLIDKLSIMEKPILSLFLSNALIDENGDNIPYLEYQLITDHPVANPTNRLESTARVDGNNGYRLLLKDEPKDLIDFAVQN